MGFLIKKAEASKFVSYETTIKSAELGTMGSFPVTLNCYDNSQSAITNKIFIPLSCSLRQIRATIAYDFLPNDHIVIYCLPATYFFYRDNILRSVDDFVYTSLYIQKTHLQGGVNIITNDNADKLTGIITMTTITGNDATIGDGDLLVSIAGYLMDI
jgi:hypothetical protein